MSVIQAAHRFGAAPRPKLAVMKSTGGSNSGLDRLIDAFISSRKMTSTGDTYRQDIAGSVNRKPGSAMTYLEFLDSRGVNFFTAIREDVDAWRQYMEKVGLSESTRAKRLAAVHGLYTYGVIDWTGSPPVWENPAKDVKRPRVGNNVQYTGLETDQIRTLLQTPTLPAYRLADRNWRRTNAIIAVLVGTGMRRNELVSADVESLAVQRGHRVLHIVRKGGMRQRMVLAPNVCAALDTYLDGRTSGPLILSEEGKRLDGSGVYRAVKGLGAYAFPGLSMSLHPHDMRHSCATLLYELGKSDWEVQTIMGHADVRTTRRYNHARLTLDESPLYALADMLVSAGGSGL